MDQKPAAIYLRTSTSLQENGLDSQRRAIEAFCAERGITAPLVFEDFGYSGRLANRPALDQLMAKARAGEISKVIVYSFSRFARSTRQLLSAVEEFEGLGVALVSITEQFDTGTPIGKSLVTILSAIGALEVDILRERVRNGLKAAVQRGKVLGRAKTRNSELIRELAKQGYSHRRIAELAKCSKTTVTRELAGPLTSAAS